MKISYHVLGVLNIFDDAEDTYLRVEPLLPPKHEEDLLRALSEPTFRSLELKPEHMVKPESLGLAFGKERTVLTPTGVDLRLERVLTCLLEVFELPEKTKAYVDEQLKEARRFEERARYQFDPQRPPFRWLGRALEADALRLVDRERAGALAQKPLKPPRPQTQGAVPIDSRGDQDEVVVGGVRDGKDELAAGTLAEKIPAAGAISSKLEPEAALAEKAKDERPTDGFVPLGGDVKIALAPGELQQLILRVRHEGPCVVRITHWAQTKAGAREIGRFNIAFFSDLLRDKQGYHVVV